MLSVDSARLQAVATETIDVRRDFTPEQIDEHRAVVTELSLKLRAIAEEKKEVAEAFKDRVDPLKAELDERLDCVKAGYRDEKVEVFLVPDFDEDKMLFISTATGEEVGSRRLRPSGRQQTLLAQLQEVGNG